AGAAHRRACEEPLRLCHGALAARLRHLDGAAESQRTAGHRRRHVMARGKRLFISLNYGWLTEGMVATGRFADARRYAAAALRRARGGDRLGEAMTYRALARASASGHGRKSAERYLALAMRVARVKDSRHEIAATQLCASEIELAVKPR